MDICHTVFLLPTVTDRRVVEIKYTAARMVIFLEVPTLRLETPVKNKKRTEG